ncbi:hypothetical protein KJ966_10230 [bacterium]|nr:hypothetical protein [bacterium]
MSAVFVCFVFWIASIVLETTFFTISHWFLPNLFFLMAAIFCLHWRGVESHYIALVFGLTADCFSSLPFGIYGLTYFVISFAVRWYAIKIFQPSWITLPLMTGFFILVENGLVLLILDTFFSVGEFSSWIKNILFHEAIPTMIFAIPAFRVLIFLEKRYRIHLAERMF